MQHKFKILTLSFCLLITSFVTMTSLAADPPPLAMLKTTAARMTRELDRYIGRLNDRLVSGIVRRILLPRFDLNTMSQRVVGKYWRGASRSTQQRFIQEFTDYVIRTYTSALASYDGEVIKFYPIRGFRVGLTRVRIKSTIEHRTAPPIQVQYRVLYRRGTWLIYDFSVDGVSIVENYRAQFASTLRKGGLNYLVQELAKRNR